LTIPTYIHGLKPQRATGAKGARRIGRDLSFKGTFKLFPKQVELLEAFQDPGVRTVLCIGAQQSGKTIAGAVALISHLVKRPKGEFALGAPTFTKLWDGTLRKFLQQVDMFPGFLVGKNETKKELHFRSGQVVFYRTYDQGLPAWEAMTLDAAWVDEAQQMPLDIFRELKNRLTVKQGKLLITARVPDPENLRDHWLYELYLQAIGDPEGKIRYIKFTAFDNPYYPQEEVEAKRRSLPPELFAAWVEGTMEIRVRDDRLFPHEAIREGFSRFEEQFSRLPLPLQAFVYRRGLSPVPEGSARLLADPELSLEGGKAAGGEAEGETIVEIGVDVAEYGGSSNVVAYRYRSTVFAVENWGALSQEELVAYLKEVDRSIKELGYYPRFWVDATGMGSPLPGRLVDLGIDAVEVKYGGKAQDSKTYYNRKSEAYFLLREKLAKELALPPVEDLRNELRGQRYGYHSADQRLKVVKPEPSPDHLDAVVLSCLGYETDVLPVYVP